MRKQTILQLNNFSIQRGDFVLCTGVDLVLKSGEIAHLVGANGSGKTTLLMQLTGLLPTPLLDSFDYKEKRPPVYVSHQLGINLDLTVRQNLQFLLNLYGVSITQITDTQTTDTQRMTQSINQTINQSISEPQLMEALAWVGLEGYQDIQCKQLSAGQTRRVNLARLRLMSPKDSPLWLLDEPFTALDTAMVARLQTRLRQFANEGGAILMTSHQTENMQNLADIHLDLADCALSSDYLSDDSFFH